MGQYLGFDSACFETVSIHLIHVQSEEPPKGLGGLKFNPPFKEVILQDLEPASQERGSKPIFTHITGGTVAEGWLTAWGKRRHRISGIQAVAP